jgi:hypothetical protein
MHFWDFMVMLVVSGSAVAVLCTWMGIRYCRDKEGLRQGASERELSGVRRELEALRQEVLRLRESHADLTLLLHDEGRKALSRHASKGNE